MNQAHAIVIAGDIVQEAYSALKPLVAEESTSLLNQCLIFGRKAQIPSEIIAWYEFEKEAEKLRRLVSNHAPIPGETIPNVIAKLLLLHVVLTSEDEFFDELAKLEELKGGGQ